ERDRIARRRDRRRRQLLHRRRHAVGACHGELAPGRRAEGDDDDREEDRVQAAGEPVGASFSRRTAFSFMISGRTSGLIASFSKSAIHRSGRITGLSVPNSTRSFSSVFAYCTSFGSKYLGDQPDRSIQTFGLCSATDSCSSCHGTPGCAITICRSGKSAATSSMWIGFAYLMRSPPPPRIPAPMPVCPVWNSAGRPASAITSYSG